MPGPTLAASGKASTPRHGLPGGLRTVVAEAVTEASTSRDANAIAPATSSA